MTSAYDGIVGRIKLMNSPYRKAESPAHCKSL